jgi:AraC-like DNA-binding protein
MFFETIRDNELYFSAGDERGDNSCLAHFHRAVEIMYVINGTKTVFLNGIKHEVKAGEALFCPPYLIHQFPQCENTTQYVATAPTEYCEKFDRFCRDKTPETYIIKDENDKIYSLITELKTPQNEIAFTGIVNRLLGIYVDRVKFLPTKDSGEKSLAYEIAEYIENNYAQEITLSSISERFGYSKNYFSALFKKLFQTGLIQYVNFIRIRKSLSFLDKNNVSSVYLTVGFNSPQQYFLNFKKYYGCSPKDYIRKMHRK